MKYYKTYKYKGKFGELSVEVDNEEDAENEFFALENDITRGDYGEEDFEWMSSVYDESVRDSPENIKALEKMGL